MTLEGMAYGKSHLRGLARGVGDMEEAVRDVAVRYEPVTKAVRVALGADEYGDAYWQARGERMAAIGTALDLLSDAMGRQSEDLARSRGNYAAGEDASTLRT
ncbi:hypothetical protein [Nonomuraea sp. NPDC049725]|uniref:hypothetical protein n=1 Tax=Nonomuraea sp. NPDC049725 TaxID=3154508 RepID=UPI00342ACF4B